MSKKKREGRRSLHPKNDADKMGNLSEWQDKKPSQLNSPFSQAFKNLELKSKLPSKSQMTSKESLKSKKKKSKEKVNAFVPKKKETTIERIRREIAFKDQMDQQNFKEKKEKKRIYEENLLRESIYAGVKPLNSKQKHIRKQDIVSSDNQEDERKARERLNNLVGGVRFIIRQGEGLEVEGLKEGVHSSFLSTLKESHAMDELDLHGYYQDEVPSKLRSFIKNSQKEEKLILRVIHGKGNHSEGKLVLQDVVIEELTKGLSANLVQAFCTASRREGGEGVLMLSIKAKK